MREIPREEIQKISQKYRDEIKTKFNIPTTISQSSTGVKPVYSREYKQFKQDYLPTHMTFYERACNFAEKVFPLKPDDKKAVVLQKYIDTSHLNITPTGATSFALFLPLMFIVLGSIFGYIIPLMFGEGTFFFVIFFVMMGAVLIIPLQNLPKFLATVWRLKASNQMVQAVFYIVTYMRHTSNLELAIKFASDHTAPPLSLDFKKILWDVETEKFESITESIDSYLETWREFNLEFIEAFHLIESSLYENEESRRVTMLDKGLSVMLTETYEKMLHYAHNLKSPITMLHMMGVILPILGLVILPLVVSFMPEVKWYWLAALYNIVLPIGVFYLGTNVLAKRPTGYGETDISEVVSGVKKHKNAIVRIAGMEISINPLYPAIIIGILFVLIGMSPLIVASSYSRDQLLAEQPGALSFLDYRVSKVDEAKMVGPFGVGAALISLFVVMGLGFGAGLYYKLRSKNIIKIREVTKKLEREFAAALFQLANRLGDGLPAEIAFGKIADVMQGTTSGKFMELVSQNVKRLGMSVEQAIFDPGKGALTFFPSSLIESSMKVLVESARKGPKIAAQALMNISNYVKEIHQVDERLKDLMADVISSMKSQISFLAPAIAGVVIGITSMVTSILGKLTGELGKIGDNVGGGAGAGFAAPNMDIFFAGDGVPTFHFQIIVGIYVVQIIYILTRLANGIENGSDKLNERYQLGKNLLRSTGLYCMIAFLVMIMFNILASSIMGSFGG